MIAVQDVLYGFIAFSYFYFLSALAGELGLTAPVEEKVGRRRWQKMLIPCKMCSLIWFLPLYQIQCLYCTVDELCLFRQGQERIKSVVIHESHICMWGTKDDKVFEQ